MFALFHSDRLFGMQMELLIEPLARLSDIKVSLQGSVQLIGHLSLADPAMLCTSEKRAAT
jgi:hypothetical protein